MNSRFKGIYNFFVKEKVKINKLTNSKDFVITLDQDNYIEDIELVVYANSEEEIEKKCVLYCINLEKILIILWGRRLRLLEKGYSIIELSTGKGRSGKALNLGWSIDGNIKELDLTNSNTNSLILAESNEGLIHLSNSVSQFYIGNPFESIKEAYKIIEKDQNLNYDKFKVIRDIFSHTPPYFQRTIDLFMKEYSNTDFDYLRFDPQNRIIILNTNSNKTLKKLNGISIELRKICKAKLNL